MQEQESFYMNTSSRGVIVNVCKINKWWLFKMVINRTKVHEIKFSNEIAAANAYNFYYNFNFGNDQLRTIKPLNDVPYMSAYEFTKYSTNNTVEAIKIIK